MANKRQQIVSEIVRLLKVNLNGVSPVITNVFENVKPRQVFLDEISDYPTVTVHTGTETREYLPGDFKWGFLQVNIRAYFKDEEAQDRIEEFLDDLETILDNNNTLPVNNIELVVDIRINSLDSDEGLLNPLGVAEVVLEVRYEI